jgi:hypothetical protein
MLLSPGLLLSAGYETIFFKFVSASSQTLMITTEITYKEQEYRSQSSHTKNVAELMKAILTCECLDWNKLRAVFYM